MAKVAYRVTRGRRKLFTPKTSGKIKAGLGDVLDRVVKPHLIKQFKQIVANWDHKPDFKARKKITTNNISLFVFPAGENKKYWIWTSKGTRPHPIVARRAPNLRFQRNHTPKTTPRPSWGGPGTKSGDWVSKKAVMHPGTEPRNIESFIFEQNKPWFGRTMENAWRRIIRRL